MGIKNIHPHVGIDYTAKRRVRSVVAENNTPTMFAPFVSNRGPENVAYKVYNNTEFITNFGQLDFSDQGQVVLNIGNWLTNGGAVLAYRMTKVSDNFKQDIANKCKVNVFRKSENVFYHTVNGLVTNSKLDFDVETKYITDLKIVEKNETDTAKIFLEDNDNTIITSYDENDEALLVLKYDDGTKRYVKNNNGELSFESTPEAGTKFTITGNANKLNIKDGEYHLCVIDKNIVCHQDTDGCTDITLLNNGRLQVVVDSKYYLLGTEGQYNFTYNPESGKNRSFSATVGTLENHITINSSKITVEYKNVADSDTRLITAWGINDTDEDFGKMVDLLVRAKYSGTFYNGIEVKLTQTGKGVFKIEIFKEGQLIESFNRRTRENYLLSVKSSDYIGELNLSDTWLAKVDTTDRNGNGWPHTISTTLKNGQDTVFTAEELPNAIKDAIVNGLTDRLSVKCDYALDAGYTSAIKTVFADAFASNDENKRVRDDVIFICDSYKLYPEENIIPEADALSNINDLTHETRSIAVYDQYLTTEDIYSYHSGAEVFVTPTYFLAGLIPYNEINHGVFYPNAGKRRGVIKDAISLSDNPLPSEKDRLYDERINYIEKDSTSMQFMSQSTYQQEDTALRFLNNSRSLNRISREVETIGRNYLHELNTVTSLNNLQAAITTYMNGWVQNRALSKCEVIVYADELDDTLVHVILNIRFSGTIEIISVEINLD